MTPEEKAKELVDKFKPYVYCYGGGTLSDPYNEAVILKMAKQCARIAVDEIVQNRKDDNIFRAQDLVYWQQVKQEIEKI